MASSRTHRPLPALLALLALLVLTGIVWFRVINRDTGAATPTSTATCTPAPPSPSPTVHLAAPDTVYVEVLNSTNRPGIAAQARSALEAAGFNSPYPPKNDSRKRLNKIRATAEIRYGAAAEQGARILRYYFPGATLKRTASTARVVVISLGTAFTQVPSKDAVAAALAKDRAVSGTPTTARSSCSPRN